MFAQEAYIRPVSTLVELHVEGVICQSGNAVIDDWNTSTEPPISF